MYRLLAALLLTACVSAHATPLGTMPAREPVPVESVRVFLDSADVVRPYTEVALVSATGDPARDNTAKLVAGMRKQAAALGADAIIVTPEPQESGVRVNVTTRHTLLRAEGVAIVFTEP